MIGGNRLAILAATIRDADLLFRRATLEAAQAAIDAGRALIEAKSLLKHGQWLPWLQANAPMSERSANRYMQLARSGMESATVADLGIGGAAMALAKHRGQETAAPLAAIDNVVTALEAGIASMADDVADVPAVKEKALPLLKEAHRLATLVTASEVEKEGLDQETAELTTLMRMRGCRGTWGVGKVTFPDDLTYDEWVHIGRVLRTMPGYPVDPVRCYVAEGLRRSKRAPFDPRHFRSKQEFLDNLIVDAASAEGRGALPKHVKSLDEPGIPPMAYEQIDASEWWDDPDPAAGDAP